VRPIDPPAFYYQRYALPGVFTVVVALPLLTREVFRALRPAAFRVAQTTVVVLMVGLTIAAVPSRYRRLANDARNIDDVQVALGRALADAAPTDNAWVIDAGAARFFGRAFVVDLMALNTPALLTSSAQAYLELREPRYLDLFPGWSKLDASTTGPLPVRVFGSSTPYTVTSFSPMHEHVLALCDPPGRTGRLSVRNRAYMFRCAG
jgi:hypothetical protein